MRKTWESKLPQQAETLRKRIERWRRTRTRISPMPERLWAIAADMAKEHGVFRIARDLRVDFGALKRRVDGADGASEAGEKSAGFIQLQPFAACLPARQAPPLSQGEAVLDFTDDTGARMNCRVTGSVEMDVIALANAFWNRRLWNRLPAPIRLPRRGTRCRQGLRQAGRR